MAGLAEVVMQWSANADHEDQQSLAVLPGGATLLSVSETQDEKKRKRAARQRRGKRQLQPDQGAEPTQESSGDVSEQALADSVPSGDADAPGEDPAGLDNAAGGADGNGGAAPPVSAEVLKQACQGIKDQASADPEQILSSLVHCVEVVKAFAELTRQKEKHSREANMEYKKHADQVLKHLVELEEYSKSIQAINEDHTLAAQHLLTSAQHTQEQITKLVTGGGS